VYARAEHPPDCGGIRALSEHLQYPELARKAGIEGRVLVQFIVDETGAVTDPTITKGAHEALNRASLVAVKKLTCEPGTVRGDPVKVKRTLPVTFKLPNDGS
jgi:protein TonB